MRKPVIGIVSPRAVNKERPFEDFTRFINNFPRRIIEAGGIPVGLLFPDGVFSEASLDLCDGFLFTGGSLIEAFQLDIMHYAISNNKPVLGVCLGMQTIAGYAWLRDSYGDLSYDVIDSNFKPSDEKYFLKKCEFHDNLNPFYLKEIDKSKHKITLKNGSLIHDIFMSKFIFEPSVHNYCVIPDIIQNSDIFDVSGMSDDGVIEVIESKDNSNFVLGVQFHPELEESNKILFKRFVNSTKR